MSITSSQCRAARALVEWPREYLAKISGVDASAITDFERKRSPLDGTANEKLQIALEDGGAVFIPENGGGAGVRLKFSSRDVRAIRRLEGEGGRVAEDDV